MSRKILVVEDNTDLLELLRLNLKEEGFAIATATNGVDALRKVRSLRPDLIVLDLQLPELDGFAVCEILRNDRETARLPIIAVSGMPGEVPHLAGLESGATEFVRKPLNPRQIVSKVEKLIGPASDTRRFRRTDDNRMVQE